MSSITNFLFQGQPVPPQPSGSDATSNFPLWYQQYLYNTAGAATNLAQQPYQPPPFGQVASPSDPTKQAWQEAINNVGNYQPALGAAGALTASGATPLSNSTIGSYAGGNASGIGALGGGLTGDVNSSIQSQIGNYLNPNLDFVSKGIESQLNTNLQQNILPGIQDRYVASGQSASPQQMQAENNATYQTQQALGQALAPVYQNAYSGALSAAQGAANTGFNLGQYSQGLGTSTAQGQQNNQLLGGAQFGQLAGANQSLGANDVAQVAGVGTAQDTLNQTNINAALNNYNNQQQYPYQQVGFLSNVLRGQQLPTTQQTTQLGYNPSAVNAASPLQAGVGTAAIVGGLGGYGRTAGFPYQGVARGGRIGVARGGRIVRRGALNLALAA